MERETWEEDDGAERAELHEGGEVEQEVGQGHAVGEVRDGLHTGGEEPSSAALQGPQWGWYTSEG